MIGAPVWFVTMAVKVTGWLIGVGFGDATSKVMVGGSVMVNPTFPLLGRKSPAPPYAAEIRYEPAGSDDVVSDAWPLIRLTVPSLDYSLIFLAKKERML